MDNIGSGAPEPHHRRKGRGWIWLFLLVVAAALAWHFRPAAPAAAAGGGGGRGGRGGGAGATVPVVVATAQSGSIPVYLTSIGTVTAANTVTLQTRVAGTIVNIHFVEGQMVRQGDLLIEIDPRPYQAALDQANGTVAQAQHTLAKDEASAADAKAEYARYSTMVQEGIVSREQFDAEKATNDSTTAAVAADEASIRADQAAVAAAQLNLQYCSITAPLSGRVGLRMVDPGNYVQPGTGMISLTQVQPITAIFNLPQATLPQVDPPLRAGQTLTVAAFDQGNTKLLANGKLLALDNSIDTTTGTYRVKAIFSNEDLALFPNQFVNLRMLVGEDSGLTIVPTAAVQRGPQGTYVFTVSNQKASMRPVTVSVSQGQQSGLSSGIAAGDEVVVDGADRLDDGTKVAVTRNQGTSTSSGNGAAGPGSGTTGAGTNNGAAVPAATSGSGSGSKSSGNGGRRGHGRRGSGQGGGQHATPGGGQSGTGSGGGGQR